MRFVAQQHAGLGWATRRGLVLSSTRSAHRQSVTLRIPLGGLASYESRKECQKIGRTKSDHIIENNMPALTPSLREPTGLDPGSSASLGPLVHARRQLCCESVRVGRLAPVPSSQAGLSRLILCPLD